MNNIVLMCEREEMDLSRSSEDVFQNAFVTDGALIETELEKVAETWVYVEDDTVIKDAIVDEELDRLEKHEEILEEEECMTEQNGVLQLQTTKVIAFDAVGALEVLGCYIGNNDTSDGKCSKAISTLRWDMQKNFDERPKQSPLISTYFSAKKTSYFIRNTFCVRNTLLVEMPRRSRGA